MQRMSEEQIVEKILTEFKDEAIYILAPVVKGRKGHYRELFEQIRKQGFSKVRVDGEILDIAPKMQVDRYKIHDIEMVVDRLYATEDDSKRLYTSVMQAMKSAKGIIKIANKEGREHFFSRYLMDPESGISYDEPQPNSFSFNSPYGACPRCDGLGYVFEIDKDSVIPDKKLSIQKGAILPLGPARESWTFQVVKAVAKKFDISTTAPVETLREEDINMLLFGGEESIPLTISYGSYGSREYKVQFDGIFKMLEELNSRGGEDAGNVDDFRTQVVCPSCEGARLKQDSLHFKIDNKNIYELANMDLTNLQSWFIGIGRRA